MAEQALTVDLGNDLQMQVTTDDSGPVLVADQKLTGGLRMVTAAIEQTGKDLSAALRAAAPTRASVELGFNISVEAGQLVALLVGKGSGEASIKVTLEWDRTAAAPGG
jgi:hypothetical protein